MQKAILLVWLCLALAACTDSNKATDPARWQAQAASVTIFRDDFGVPHIYGKTDADAVFGMLYAQCEDDFQRVAILPPKETPRSTFRNLWMAAIPPPIGRACTR